MAFDELFAEWKKKYPTHAFISDGVVDAVRYEEPHVLFVLRDMNCSTEFDLRWHLREHGSGWKTWNNVGRWTMALLDGTAEYPASMPKSVRREQVRRIAAMNLKKEGGGARAEGGKMLQAVRSQKDMILREIELCDPHIIISCGLSAPGIDGNAVLLHDHVFDGLPEWRSFRSPHIDRMWHYYYVCINDRMVPIISFCHPQVTSMNGLRGHALFEPLYRDMLYIRECFFVEGCDEL